MKYVKKIATTLLLCAITNQVSSRSFEIQEQNESYWTKFFKGVLVGVEDLIDFMRDEETENMIVDSFDEKDRTEIQVVGIGLGRTGTTSVVMDRSCCAG